MTEGARGFTRRSMSKQTVKRQKTMAAKRARKASIMKRNGGESTYARKRDYCNKHGVWGFEVPEPKPWKKS
jgi:desulfoferrodoxin (superoxide reductase-like protein)